jgi:hypothetical protein
VQQGGGDALCFDLCESVKRGLDGSRRFGKELHTNFVLNSRFNLTVVDVCFRRVAGEGLVLTSRRCNLERMNDSIKGGDRVEKLGHRDLCVRACVCVCVCVCACARARVCLLTMSMHAVSGQKSLCFCFCSQPSHRGCDNLFTTADFGGG